MLTKILSAGALALTVASPAWAEIVVTDAYARSTMPGAPTGAAFMVIGNTGETDDRLVEVLSDVAERVELHTHRAEGDGVVRMVHVEEGIVIPAGGQHALQRGGDHVMMMGLTRDLKQGDTFALTLVFENAGERKIEVPVDLKRVADHSGMAHD
ncbi:copper chaperone PCu(A)C [Citreimonas salinaria]